MINVFAMWGGVKTTSGQLLVVRFGLLLVRAVLVFVLVGCNGGSSSTHTFSGSFTVSSPSVELPLEINSFLIITVLVNGVSGRFILDTGADVFAVSSEFADRVGLAEVGRTTITTVAGRSEVNLRRIDEFQFANVVGVDIDAAELNFSGFDGAVGAPFFKQVIVAIDYSKSMLSIHDASQVTLEQLRGDNTELFKMKEFKLQESLVVNGVAVNDVVIDTGSAGGLHLSQNQVGDAFEGEKNSFATTLTSSNGTLAGTAFIADDLALGSFLLQDQFVVVQDGSIKNGLLGNLILQQFTVVLDYSGGNVLFRLDRSLKFGFATIELSQVDKVF